MVPLPIYPGIDFASTSSLVLKMLLWIHLHKYQDPDFKCFEIPGFPEVILLVRRTLGQLFFR